MPSSLVPNQRLWRLLCSRQNGANLAHLPRCEEELFEITAELGIYMTAPIYVVRRNPFCFAPTG